MGKSTFTFRRGCPRVIAEPASDLPRHFPSKFHFWRIWPMPFCTALIEPNRLTRFERTLNKPGPGKPRRASWHFLDRTIST